MKLSGCHEQRSSRGGEHGSSRDAKSCLEGKCSSKSSHVLCKKRSNRYKAQSRCSVSVYNRPLPPRRRRKCPLTVMPSDQSTWLIAVPQDGDSEGLLPEITTKLHQQSRSTTVAELHIPSFKVSFAIPIETYISSGGCFDYRQAHLIHLSRYQRNYLSKKPRSPR